MADHSETHAHPLSDYDSKAVPASSFVPPSYTVADLQQNVEPQNTGMIGGTNSDEDEKIIQNIVLMVHRYLLWPKWWIFLFFFCFLPILGLLVPYFVYKREKSNLDKIVQSGIRYMIRLEGDQWSRYVQHIDNEPDRIKSKSLTQKLLSRGYGHVLIAPEGFYLDAMVAMQYDNIMILRTEVIRAPNNIDMILRAWFCRRTVVVAVQNGHPVGNMNNDPFKFDIFLPSTMSTDLLTSITNFMKLESKCRPTFVV